MGLDRTRTDAAPAGKLGLLARLGAAPLGVWAIKHLLSPLDRRLYRWTGGRRIALGRPLAPRLLLTATGRRTGQERTVPVFYLRDGNCLIICNVNPGFERLSPWPLNLRAHPVARVQVGSVGGTYYAREATADEVERYWPRLVALWPAYQTHVDRSRQRSIFILEPSPTPRNS